MAMRWLVKDEIVKTGTKTVLRSGWNKRRHGRRTRDFGLCRRADVFCERFCAIQCNVVFLVFCSVGRRRHWALSLVLGLCGGRDETETGPLLVCAAKRACVGSPDY